MSSRDKKVPSAFLNDRGEVVSELNQPIDFGENKYYVPEQDLARLSAAHDNIKELKGEEEAKEFAENIKRKARYYREKANKLWERLDSADLKSESEEKRKLEIKHFYLKTRENSALADLPQNQKLDTIHSAELGKKYEENQTSDIRVGLNGYQGQSVWVAIEEEGSKTQLIDRGLQDRDKYDRYFEKNGEPKTVCISSYNSNEITKDYVVADPDSHLARRASPHHIPFGFSSGGKREFEITPRKEYVERTVSDAKKELGEGAKDDKKLSENINRQNQQKKSDISFVKLPDNSELFKAQSFDHKKGKRKPYHYDKSVAKHLESSRMKDENVIANRTENNTRSHTIRGPPNSSEKNDKASLLSSMKNDLAKGKESNKKQGI